MDGKANLDSGSAAAAGDSRAVRKQGHATLVFFVSLSLTLVTTVLCSCTDTNFTMRFLTPDCSPYSYTTPHLSQVTKHRSRWLSGRSAFNDALRKVSMCYCIPEMLQVLYADCLKFSPILFKEGIFKKNDVIFMKLKTIQYTKYLYTILKFLDWIIYLIIKMIVSVTIPNNEFKCFNDFLPHSVIET